MNASGQGRSGFTIVELVVAMVVMTIVGGSLASLLVGQLDFQRTEDAMRDSRSSARAALNVLLSDMRMLETGGGVAAAAAQDITIRVPYSYGVICTSSPAATTISLMPLDSTAFASAGRSGWAWRDAGTGGWNYQDVALTLAAGGAAVCNAAQVQVLAGGRALTIAPGAAGLTIGTPAMLYQRIRYRFDNSVAFPGRDALFRTVEATAQDSELVAPFASTARFRFYTDWDGPAQDAVPADLSDIVGFEISLDTESAADSPRRGGPEPFSLTTSVFFKNVTN